MDGKQQEFGNVCIQWDAGFHSVLITPLLIGYSCKLPWFSCSWEIPSFHSIHSANKTLSKLIYAYESLIVVSIRLVLGYHHWCRLQMLRTLKGEVRVESVYVQYVQEWESDICDTLLLSSGNQQTHTPLSSFRISFSFWKSTFTMIDLSMCPPCVLGMFFQHSIVGILGAFEVDKQPLMFFLIVGPWNNTNIHTHTQTPVDETGK